MSRVNKKNNAKNPPTVITTAPDDDQSTPSATGETANDNQAPPSDQAANQEQTTTANDDDNKPVSPDEKAQTNGDAQDTENSQPGTEDQSQTSGSAGQNGELDENHIQNGDEENETEGDETRINELDPIGARPLELEPYVRQKPKWPRDGKHILAQFDHDSVVVYQAFNEDIAQYAVDNQQLGGPRFSFTRMSWIKTNFLWMMYRCGWATKENQEHVLAVRITREGFDEIISNAYTAKFEKSQLEKPDVQVRLQWDPDHGPNGSNERRRAIQLGLKKDILKQYATDFIVSIEDITDLVMEQHHHATKGSIVKLMTPRERVYHVEDEEVAHRLGVDTWDDIEEDEDDW